MKAAWYERTGPARDVFCLGHVDVPSPGSREVRVRVVASGVNPSDVRRRSGELGSKLAFPRIIPHSDGAGIIDAVGDRVIEYKAGNRVWLHNAQWQRWHGTAAEYVVLPVDQVAPLAAHVTFAEGACLGVPAMTAHRCLFAGNPVLRDQTVLVMGGAGAVGAYAVQLAKWARARVIVTVSSEEKAAVARRAGADHVIDYTREDTLAAVLAYTEGAGVDRVIDVNIGAHPELLSAVLKAHGVAAIYSSPAEYRPAIPVLPLMMKNITLHFVLVYDIGLDMRRRACVEINRWLDSGKAVHTIAARLPLDQIADAHALQESRSALGNIIVDVEQ